MGFSSWSLKKQFLVSFASVATISLVTILSVVIANLAVLTQQTVSMSQTSISQQISTNMALFTKETAAAIKRRFQQAEQQILKLLATATEDSFKASFPFNIQTSYYDKNHLAAGSTHSVVYKKGTTTYAQLRSSGTSANTVDKSSNLDFYMSRIYSASPMFKYIYMGFSQAYGEVFREFPAMEVSIDRTYDHLVRPWYTEASKATKKNEVCFIEPYRDAQGAGWMITLAYGMYDESSALLGVVGADLTVIEIAKSVLSVKFVKTGYAALVQKNGIVVAHPKWNLDQVTSTTTIKQVEPNLPATDWTKMIESTTSGSLIITETYANGTKREFYLTYAPLGTTYIVFVKVPKDEAEASVRRMSSDLSIVNVGAYIAVVAIAALSIILVLLIIISVSTRITERLWEMVGGLHSITQKVADGGKIDHPQTQEDGNGSGTGSAFSRMLRAEAFDGSQEDEISELRNGFNLLVKKLKKDQEDRQGEDNKLPRNPMHGKDSPWISQL